MTGLIHTLATICLINMGRIHAITGAVLNQFYSYLTAEGTSPMLSSAVELFMILRTKQQDHKLEKVIDGCQKNGKT